MKQLSLFDVSTDYTCIRKRLDVYNHWLNDVLPDTIQNMTDVDYAIQLSVARENRATIAPENKLYIILSAEIDFILKKMEENK